MTEETHQVTAEEQNQMVMAQTFDVDLIKVRVMVGEYKKMELAPGDDEQYAVCRTALTSCIRVRTGIDKRRLELNANAQDEIKARNISAKQLSEIVAPAESHLSGLIATEGARLIKIKEAEAEALKKLIDERQMALSALNCPTPYQEVAAMDEIDYDNALFSAKEDFDEAERVREEKEEERKAEDKRLADQKADQDRKAADQKAAQDKLDADRKTLDAEKARIAKEQADKQAEIDKRFQAERDAKVKAAREATEKKEAERWALKAKEREEEMGSDKAKLTTFLCRVQIAASDVQCAPLSTTEGARELSRSFDEIRSTIEDCKKRAEEL